MGDIKNRILYDSGVMKKEKFYLKEEDSDKAYYSCSLCGKTFKDKDLYDRHRDKKNQNKKFFCVGLKENSEEDFQLMVEDEVITEGLKIFKKSNQLNKFADKIERKMLRAGDRGKDAKFSYLKTLSKDLRDLSKKFGDIERGFAEKKMNRAQAGQKIKALKNSNQSLLIKLKSQQAKDAFKIIGLSAVGIAAIALLGHFGETITKFLFPAKTTSASSFYLRMGIE